MREIVQSKIFKRDYKKVATSGRYSIHDFLTVIEMLANDEELPHKYRDHIVIFRRTLHYDACKAWLVQPTSDIPMSVVDFIIWLYGQKRTSLQDQTELQQFLWLG